MRHQAHKNFRKTVFLLAISSLVGLSGSSKAEVMRLQQKKKKVNEIKITSKEESENVKVVKKVVTIKKYYKRVKHNSTTKYYNIPLSKELQRYTIKTCKEHKIDPVLVFAIMKQESDFNKNLLHKNRNCTVDSGLMQINSCNFKWVNDLAGRKLDVVNSPKDNILAGVLIIKYNVKYWKKRSGDENAVLKKVIISYNRGTYGAKKYISKHGYNNKYLKSVMKYYKKIKKDGGL